MKKAKTNPVPITALPIEVWAPTREGQRYLSRIGDLPMIFFGDTALEATKAADTWRWDEVAKAAARKERGKALGSRRKEQEIQE